MTTEPNETTNTSVSTKASADAVKEKSGEAATTNQPATEAVFSNTKSAASTKNTVNTSLIDSVLGQSQKPQGSSTATSASTTGPNTKQILLMFICAVVSCLLTVIVLNYTGIMNRAQSSPGDSITINTDKEDVQVAEAVAAKAMQSVVYVAVYGTKTQQQLPYPFGNGSSTSTTELIGSGSGVILSSDGYILTNYHVVESGTIFQIELDKQTSYEAKLVGSDPSSDLAVLKVDGASFTPIELGNSDELNTGQWVAALGSPFGYEKSITTGIISGLLRSTVMQSTSGASIYSNLIQTDAAINPGNSGGAMVNAKGQLIGINSLISSSSGTSSGVGFAIPANYAKAIADQIIAGKTVEHAYLGVTISDYEDSANANVLNRQHGALIKTISKNTAAAKAGLQEGDIITKVNDTKISSGTELIIAIRGYFVGDTVQISYIRNGVAGTADVTLGSDAPSSEA